MIALQRFKKCGFLFAFLALAVVMSSFPISRGYAEEQWEIVLRQQLYEEKQCDLNFMTNVRKFELAGEPVIEARVHCIDARQFDVVRRKKHLKFEIRACQPTIC